MSSEKVFRLKSNGHVEGRQIRTKEPEVGDQSSSFGCVVGRLFGLDYRFSQLLGYTY